MRDARLTDVAETAVADRRNFIKLAGATAAGAGVTAATAGIAVAAEPPAADAQYQETAHIKRYYETAR